jgi:hypothetical protein
MGGSGSGGGGGIYVPSKPEQVECKDMTITTSLNSPVPEIIKLIKRGDHLDIVIDKFVLLAKFNGEVAGSITHVLYMDLIKCIKKGNIYVGVVIQKIGGNCEIQIIHKNKL